MVTRKLDEPGPKCCTALSGNTTSNETGEAEKWSANRPSISAAPNSKCELMRYCKKAVTSRLDRSLDTTVKILQMRQLFETGFNLYVFPVWAEKILQAQQAAKLEYRKSKTSRTFDCLAKFCFDLFCTFHLHVGCNKCIDAAGFGLDPKIGTFGYHCQTARAGFLCLLQFSLETLGLSQAREMSWKRKAKIDAFEPVDGFRQHRNAVFEVAVLAQCPAHKCRAEQTEWAKAVLVRQSDQLLRLALHFSLGPAQTEQPAAHICSRQCRRLRMTQGVGRLERVEPDLKGLVDLAKAEQRDAQQ